ncbi:hypothetical protein BGX26_005737 [Mortierella sp. AD094]|nr:hypothetical protein BGX26_005737 [Mortierella sp. AD094]
MHKRKAANQAILVFTPSICAVANLSAPFYQLFSVNRTTMKANPFEDDGDLNALSTFAHLSNEVFQQSAAAVSDRNALKDSETSSRTVSPEILGMTCPVLCKLAEGGKIATLEIFENTSATGNKTLTTCIE